MSGVERVSGPLLTARGIVKAFGGHAVLHGIDLDIHGGEVLALIGENGAGKSTFVNILSGTITPSSGSIRFDGVEAPPGGRGAALKLGIVHIHQDLSIIGALSVMENLFLGDYLASAAGFVNRRRMAARARDLLSQVGAQRIDPRRVAGTLSTAEQQLIEIAKALSRDVQLLILDEPTASLTTHEADTLFSILRELKGRGVGIVFISHRIEEVERIADRVVVLRDGRIVSDRPAAAAARDDMIRDMTGRAFALADVPTYTGPAEAPVVLRVEGLTDGRGIGPLSFELRAGEILGIFGLVGAGRTELLEVIAGLRPPASGSASCLGRSRLPRHAGEAWRWGIAILPEGRKRNGLCPNLSVLENICLSARQSAALLLAPGRERMQGEALRRDLGIVAGSLGAPIHTLSGGNQQKALFGRCLAAQPAILLLDEPTHGIDVRTKADLYRLIQDLARKGLAVVFVSSELPEIRALATRIMVLAHGQVTLLKPNTGLDEDDLLSHAFGAAAPAVNGAPDVIAMVARVLARLATLVEAWQDASRAAEPHGAFPAPSGSRESLGRRHRSPG